MLPTMQTMCPRAHGHQHLPPFLHVSSPIKEEDISQRAVGVIKLNFLLALAPAEII